MSAPEQPNCSPANRCECDACDEMSGLDGRRRDIVLCLVAGTRWFRWVLIDVDSNDVIGYFRDQERAVAELERIGGPIDDEEEG